MPFKSKAQRGFLWAKKPDIAKEFEKKTPNGKKLPILQVSTKFSN